LLQRLFLEVFTLNLNILLFSKYEGGARTRKIRERGMVRHCVNIYMIPPAELPSGITIGRLRLHQGPQVTCPNIDGEAM
jgi:hypothetical protein